MQPEIMQHSLFRSLWDESSELIKQMFLSFKVPSDVAEWSRAAVLLARFLVLTQSAEFGRTVCGSFQAFCRPPSTSSHCSLV